MKCDAGVAVEPTVKRVARRYSRRRGAFAGHWVARCKCGWRGPGRKARWEAVFDARAHRDGWEPNDPA